jgi:hypothetical protein
MSFMKKDVNDQSLDARLLFGSWISLSGDHDQLVEFAIFRERNIGAGLAITLYYKCKARPPHPRPCA